MRFHGGVMEEKSSPHAQTLEMCYCREMPSIQSIYKMYFKIIYTLYLVLNKWCINT